MTCAHVLGLIDAGPFADYPRMHLDAAWQHARQCATCGPALETTMALTADLAALPQLAPPPDLTATVMARIARIERAKPSGAGATMPARRVPSSTRDWSAWATILGGLAAGVAIVLSTPLGNMASIEIAWPGLRGFAASLAIIPSTPTGALAVAAGLLIYVVGLFGPVNDRSAP